MGQIEIISVSNVGDPAGCRQRGPVGAIKEVDIHQRRPVILRKQHTQIDIIVGSQAQCHICRGVIADACVKETEAEGSSGIDPFLAEVRSGIFDHVGNAVFSVFGIFALPVFTHAPVGSVNIRRPEGKIRNGEQAIVAAGGNQRFDIGNGEETLIRTGSIGNVPASDQTAVSFRQDQLQRVGARPVFQGDVIALSGICEPAGTRQ